MAVQLVLASPHCAGGRATESPSCLYKCDPVISQNNLVSVGYSTMWRMVNFIRVKVQYKSELQVLWILQFS